MVNKSAGPVGLELLDPKAVLGNGELPRVVLENLPFAAA
jgi:hypothetical protein